MTGNIFNIERYAIHDGEGIRTQVFLKGCPLACAWCANPEGIKPKFEIVYHRNRCMLCGVCKKRCKQNAIQLFPDHVEIDQNRCIKCKKCIEGCYADAILMMGRRTTVDDVLKKVIRDKDFYQEGHGGITLCGGEPLMQADFARELLKEAKDQGISTDIETCGAVPFEAFTACLPYLDHIFFDLKFIDSAKHLEYTGKDNKLILENLQKLQDFDVPITVRIPVIPGVNDDEDNIKKTALFIKELPKVIKVELLPYHRLGVSKYKLLGLNYTLNHVDVPTKESLQPLKEIFTSLLIPCQII